MNWCLMLIAALVAFAVGHFLGRRAGERAGREAGVREAGLKIRQKAWEEGECPICKGARQEKRSSE